MLSCPYGMYVFPVFYCLQKYIFPSWTWFLCQILNNIKVASSGLDNHVMPKTEWVVENVVVETCPSSFTKKKNIFVLPSYCGCCCCYYPPSPLRLLPFYADWQSADWGRERKTVFSNGGHLGKPGLEEGAAAPLLDSFHEPAICPFSFQSDVSGAGAPRSSLSRYLKKYI